MEVWMSAEADPRGGLIAVGPEARDIAGVMAPERIEEWARYAYEVVSTPSGGIAHFRVRSAIAYNADWLDVSLGSMPAEVLCDGLVAASQDPDVHAVIIDAHCPGGSSHARGDLKAARRTLLNAGKPLIVVAHEQAGSLMALLGVWADEFWATPTAEVGCIGTRIMLEDSSQAAAKAGIAVRQIAWPAGKAQPAWGVPVTEEMVAEYEATAERLGSEFVAEVGEHRGLSGEALDAVATGGMFGARDALELGLIDRVVEADELLGTLSELMESGGPGGVRDEGGE